MPPDPLADELLGSLKVYAQRYGLPEPAEQVQGIVGSLLTVKAQAEAVVVKTGEVDHVIQQVMAKMNPQVLAAAGVDHLKTALAEQAYRRQQSLQQQVSDTLNAYIQNYAPGMTGATLCDTVLAIMPLINDGNITRAEVNGLVSQMATTFSLEAALAARINPTYVGVAKHLVIALSQRPMETAVGETVVAYVEKFAPAMENITEDLIENALSAVLKNKVEFGLDTDLNLANRQLLINQISFKINIMKMSPPPSKTTQQMAAELSREIERFKQERANRLGTPNAAAGLVAEDGLSISSGWTSTRRPASPSGSSQATTDPTHPGPN
ncbi:MAG: hypothetical protein ACFCVD_08810 [Nodosilinea sp.]